LKQLAVFFDFPQGYNAGTAYIWKIAMIPEKSLPKLGIFTPSIASAANNNNYPGSFRGQIRPLNPLQCILQILSSEVKLAKVGRRVETLRVKWLAIFALHQLSWS
jgi:hypothetical protein